MDYRTLAAEAEKDPQNTDFTALRHAYVESEEYQPISHFSYAKLKGNTNSCRTIEEVEFFCKKVLADNPMDLEARMMLEFVYEQLEQYDLAAQAHAFISGMLDAIFASGDGKAFESALHVVAVAEEYTLLSVRGFQSLGQALIEHNGRYYDILDCVSGKEPKSASVQVYFDITAPFTYLQNMLE